MSLHEHLYARNTLGIYAMYFNIFFMNFIQIINFVQKTFNMHFKGFKAIFNRKWWYVFSFSAKNVCCGAH